MFWILITTLLASTAEAITNCPAMCTCNSKSVNCINKGITSSQLANIKFPADADLIGLANNSITTIPKDVFTNLNTRIINLSENQITEIADGAFNESVDQLFLNHNRLETISDWFVNNPSSMAQVYLDENPLKCSCKMVESVKKVSNVHFGSTCQTKRSQNIIINNFHTIIGSNCTLCSFVNCHQGKCELASGGKNATCKCTKAYKGKDCDEDAKCYKGGKYTCDNAGHHLNASFLVVMFMALNLAI